MATLRDSIIIDPQAVREQRRPSFFGFDIFITPLLIQLGFIIGVLACLVAGCWMLREHWSVRDAVLETWREQGRAIDIWSLAWNELGFWPGATTLVLGPIAIRIGCEAMIVIFKIFAELRRR